MLICQFFKNFSKIFPFSYHEIDDHSENSLRIGQFLINNFDQNRAQFFDHGFDHGFFVLIFRSWILINNFDQTWKMIRKNDQMS